MKQTTTGPAHGRRSLHLRRISCEAFERDDGMFDIEGVVIDTQPREVELITGRKIPPGEHIHQMRLCITVNRDQWIVAASAHSEARPYQECKAAEAVYQQLVGMRIEPGFTRKVKQLFRGEAGCTHMTELIPSMATTLFQVLWSDSEFASIEPGSATPLGACRGLSRDGHIVRTYFPTHSKDLEP